MNNVYDLAHELARSLKETDQCKNFVKAKAKADANEAVSKMVSDFLNKNVEFQNKMMTTGKEDPELMNQVQQLYAVVMQDPLAAEYLNAQYAYSQVLAEVYQIIGDAANGK